VAEFGSMSDLSSSHVPLSPINKEILLTDMLFQKLKKYTELKIHTLGLGLEQIET
jgi:hypothetical protein